MQNRVHFVWSFTQAYSLGKDSIIEREGTKSPLVTGGYSDLNSLGGSI